ncbi:MAG: hypothetical protein H6734_28390 [Alphaproteobacteria bacterium]|nr:hypothetical protein [Alphaproteobacteria bacterium]MCB9684310.1 hypothetical protein [Alphaproteobacteria bacterium]
MVWWFGPAALAGEPMVHEGDAGAAVDRVARAARLSPEEIDAVAVAALRARPATMVGSGEVLSCAAKPVTREQLQLALDGAEAALTYDETDRARKELDRVADVASCPPPFDRPLLVRYWVDRALAGVEPELSVSRARGLDPELAWSEEWPSDLRPAFDEAAPLPPVIVRVVHDGVTVDGQTVQGQVSLVPGWHPVQVGSFDGALLVDADAVFVVPSATPADLLGSAGDEAGRAAATALMADAFGAGRRVFVATDSGVWAASAGRTDWLPLERVRTHPLVPVGAVTTVVGVGATVGFGALAVLTHGNAEAAVDAAFQSSGTAAFDQARADYDAARGGYRLATMALIPSGLVLVGGAGMLGFGLLHGPVVTPGGGR